MRLAPFRDHILLKPHWLSDTQGYDRGVKASGVIEMPQNIKQVLTPWGIVLAVGPDATEGLQKGTKVLFNAYAERRFKTGAGIEFLIVNEDDIITEVDEFPETAQVTLAGAQGLVD